MRRHQLILDRIAKDKYVEVTTLSGLFKVSAVTIRKDLKLLEDKGLLYRTHGGAQLNNPYAMDKSVNEKERLFTREKNMIATVAATRIGENDSALLASGTTVLALSRAIIPTGRLKVITSSLPVAIELIKHKDIEVIQLGGKVRNSSISVIGESAEAILSHIACPILFLGVDGIDLDFGLSTTSIEEASLNRKMMQAANKTIVLADASKFGKKSFGKICMPHEISEIITDSGIAPAWLKKMHDMGVKVTVA